VVVDAHNNISVFNQRLNHFYLWFGNSPVYLYPILAKGEVINNIEKMIKQTEVLYQGLYNE